MNTSLLFDHEPVADGGFFARLVLVLTGGAPNAGLAPGAEPPGPVLHGAPEPLSDLPPRAAARNVQVAVRPGRDAEFIQMTHGFESAGSGRLLTISVGDLYALDQVRIRMEALVGPGHGIHGEADVGRLVVLAHVHGEDGAWELHTVNLPIRLSAAHGGRVLPALGSTPVSSDAPTRIWGAPRGSRDEGPPGSPRCA